MDPYTHGVTGPQPSGEESASRMTESAAIPGMMVESVTMRPGPGGGFVVTCHKMSPGPKGGKQSRDYTFSSAAEAMAYIATEFGQPSSSPAPNTPTDAQSAVPTHKEQVSPNRGEGGVSRQSGQLIHTGLSDTRPTHR